MMIWGDSFAACAPHSAYFYAYALLMLCARRYALKSALAEATMADITRYDISWLRAT